MRRSGKPLLAAIRRCVTDGPELTDEDFFAIELEEAVRLCGTPDFKVGIQAFLGRPGGGRGAG